MEIDQDIPSQNTVPDQTQPVGASTVPPKEEKKNDKLVIIIAIVAIVFVLFIIGTVISLVMVGLSLQVMNSGTGVPEAQVRATWKSTQPIGINDWGFNASGTELTAILRNNSSQTILFKEMTLANGIIFTEDKNVASGATYQIAFSGINCIAGQNYSYPKENISILYDTPTIKDKTQKALADIIGTC